MREADPAEHTKACAVLLDIQHKSRVIVSLEKRLESLFGPLTQLQASYNVYAIETIYPTYTKIFIPHSPIEKLSRNRRLLSRTN